MDLGHQCPSLLLSKLRELANNSGTTRVTVKNLWLTRLDSCYFGQQQCRYQVTDDLASLADKIMKKLRNGEIAAVGTPSSSAATEAINSELSKQLRDMSMELKSVREEVCSFRSRQMQRGFSRRYRSSSRSRFDDQGR